MAAPKRYLQIEGIFETEVLGTFSIIRGFADLRDLAKISVPVLMEEAGPDGQVTGHQRPLDETHADEVKRYFESGNQRFIPEVILSLRVPFTQEMDGSRQLGVTYAGEGIQLDRKHSSKGIPNHLLKIELSKIDALCAAKRIRRIDGNHRLAKAKDLPTDDAHPNRYKAPFCLLLLGDVGDTAQDYTEALIFHTINSTAKPLDSEQALKLIFGQPAGQTLPAHQEFALAPALHLTRLIDAGIRGLSDPAKTRLGGRPLARLSVAAKELIHSYPTKATDLANLTAFSREILAALSDIVTHLHGEFPDFCKAEYFVELVTHVWLRSDAATPPKPHALRLSESLDYLRGMARWMGSDGMRGLTVSNPLGRQLISVYDAMQSRVPKRVFLARWYPDASDTTNHAEANHRVAALRALTTELHLELVDLPALRGGTYAIRETMYNSISGCDIFIGDMTGCRLNVMVEIGYALHHVKSGRMLLIFHPTTAVPTVPEEVVKSLGLKTSAQTIPGVPFDLSDFRYEAIGDSGDIGLKLKPHLQAILDEARAGRI